MASNELYSIDNKKTRIILKCLNNNYFLNIKEKVYTIFWREYEE